VRRVVEGRGGGTSRGFPPPPLRPPAPPPLQALAPGLPSTANFTPCPCPASRPLQAAVHCSEAVAGEEGAAGDLQRPEYSTDAFRMFSFKIDCCPRLAESHDWTLCPFQHPGEAGVGKRAPIGLQARAGVGGLPPPWVCSGVAANTLIPCSVAQRLVCPLSPPLAGPNPCAAGEKARRRDPRSHKYQGVPCPDFRKVTAAAAFAATLSRPCRARCLLPLLRITSWAAVLALLPSLRLAVRCGCWVCRDAPAQFEPLSYVCVSARLLPRPQGTCKRGDACSYAHGVFECWLHPSRYRTQLCKEGAACRRSVCFFAHSVEQLREPTMTGPGGCPRSCELPPSPLHSVSHLYDTCPSCA
jgi:hypothetical protein